MLTLNDFIKRLKYDGGLDDTQVEFEIIDRTGYSANVELNEIFVSADDKTVIQFYYG